MGLLLSDYYMSYILLSEIYLYIKLNQPEVAQLRHKPQANFEIITTHGYITLDLQTTVGNHW